MSGSSVPNFRLPQGFIVRRRLPETRQLPNGKVEDAFLSVSPDKLEDIINEELRCPICLGTIQDTSTVTTCIHRFCEECVHKSLRSNLSSSKTHQECPSCRAKLASKRSTRSDAGFDTIIQLLTTAYELSQQQTSNTHSSMSKLIANGSFDMSSFRSAHEDKIIQFKRKQQRMVAEGVLQRNPPSSSSSSSRQASSSNSKATPSSSSTAAAAAGEREKSTSPRAQQKKQDAVYLNAQPKVCLSLSPWRPNLNLIANGKRLRESMQGVTFIENPDDVPDVQNDEQEQLRFVQLKDLPLPYLKIPPLMQVGHLKNFVLNRLDLEKSKLSVLELLVIHEKKVVVLDDCLTLGDLTITFWEAKSELQLFYRLHAAGNV
jgi:hypothetical protein